MSPQLEGHARPQGARRLVTVLVTAAACSRPNPAYDLESSTSLQGSDDGEGTGADTTAGDASGMTLVFATPPTNGSIEAAGMRGQAAADALCRSEATRQAVPCLAEAAAFVL
ncbi:MAG: hypothetical protein KDK70_27100, partial [Myxococcales bacterium]|nr:hypothetical protein [Myxococcales bacterium]